MEPAAISTPPASKVTRPKKKRNQGKAEKVRRPLHVVRCAHGAAPSDGRDRAEGRMLLGHRIKGLEAPREGATGACTEGCARASSGPRLTLAQAHWIFNPLSARDFRLLRCIVTQLLYRVKALVSRRLDTLERQHLPKQPREDWPSDRSALAVGLFARLTDAIDHGRFSEAAETKTKLAELGFIVTLCRDRTKRADGKGVGQ